MTDNRQRVLERFSQQADRFEKRGSSVAHREWVRWAASLIELRSDRRALDVAGGTGLMARSVAAGVKSVVVLDLTPAMLEQGQTAAASERLTNVVFMRGDAKRLPFPTGSFDIVMTRFSLHHIPEPEEVVAEMKRVAAADGQVAVVDLIAADDPNAAAEYNRLERLRDASHVRALDRHGLESLLTAAGLKISRSDTRQQQVELEDWLALTQPSADAVRDIRRTLEQEIQGGRPTGFQPFFQDERLCFTQTALALLARPA